MDHHETRTCCVIFAKMNLESSPLQDDNLVLDQMMCHCSRMRNALLISSVTSEFKNSKAHHVLFLYKILTRNWNMEIEIGRAESPILSCHPNQNLTYLYHNIGILSISHQAFIMIRYIVHYRYWVNTIYILDSFFTTSLFTVSTIRVPF